jgi:hypothetical protein
MAEYARIEGARLGLELPGGAARFLELKESAGSTVSTPLGVELADTECTDADGAPVDPAAHCVIHLGLEAHLDGDLRGTIAHEVFHAYEAVMSGTLLNFNRKGDDWLVEGAAQWVESDLVRVDLSAPVRWAQWLRSPATPLFSRSYDAVGFFGHLASSGISPWSRFKAMFAAKSSPEAWAAGVGGSLPYLDSEASSFFRSPAFGAEWDQTGRGVPPAGAVGFRPPRLALSVASLPRTIDAKPYTDGVDEVSFTHPPKLEPLVELRAESGYVRLHGTSGGHVNQIVSGHILLCTARESECRCPSAPAHFQMFTRGDLAITGAPKEAPCSWCAARRAKRCCRSRSARRCCPNSAPRCRRDSARSSGSHCRRRPPSRVAAKPPTARSWRRAGRSAGPSSA